MTVWLYTINPSAPAGWTYGWDVDKPETLLASTDKVWPTANFFRKIKPRDQIAVYMKNTGCETGDGIYIVGSVVSVDEDARELTWRPDRAQTAPLLDAPLPPELVYELFGRGYGGALRRLKPDRAREWKRLLRQMLRA